MAVEEKNESGDANDLVPKIYAQLRELAEMHMRGERSDHTLQPTALVHEAYLRLVGRTGAIEGGKANYLALASQAVRHVLVDHARARKRRKRGGKDAKRIPLANVERSVGKTSVNYIALDDALNKLAETAPREAKVVELRFFGGLSDEEIADHLGVSRRTVQLDWSHAKAWLHRELEDRES